MTIGVSISEESLQNSIPQGMQLEKCSNKSLLDFFPKKYSVCFVTKGMCSCDLFPFVSNKEDTSVDIQKKYKKKSWSEKKIKRAIEDRKKTVFQSPQKYCQSEFFSWIKQLKDNGKDIFFIAHYYSGLLHEEKIKINKTCEFPLKNFPIHPLQEDILYQFV